MFVLPGVALGAHAVPLLIPVANPITIILTQDARIRHSAFLALFTEF
jgi:hypothetical protein